MKEQFAASAARKQPRREKSPSELGEEVLALMLSEDAKERAAATPAPPKIRAAAGTPKAAQYGRFTQEAAENAKTTQYGSGFTEKNRCRESENRALWRRRGRADDRAIRAAAGSAAASPRGRRLGRQRHSGCAVEKRLPQCDAGDQPKVSKAR